MGYEMKKGLLQNLPVCGSPFSVFVSGFPIPFFHFRQLLYQSFQIWFFGNFRFKFFGSCPVIDFSLAFDEGEQLSYVVSNAGRCEVETYLDDKMGNEAVYEHLQTL